MILIGLVGGLILGLIAGGKMGRLLDVRLRWAAPIAVVALALRIGTQTAIANGSELADQLRLPLYGAAFGILAAALWLNRRLPGLLAVFVGVVANGVAIVVNGGVDARLPRPALRRGADRERPARRVRGRAAELVGGGRTTARGRPAAAQRESGSWTRQRPA